MEHGVARIANGVGQIDTPNPPAPVGFDPAACPDVTDGDAVRFIRSAAHPDFAVQVVRVG